MEVKDAKKVVKNLRKEGYDDGQIVYAFSMMLINGELYGNEYIGLCDVLGFEADDSFVDMTDQEKIKYLKEYYNVK